MRKNWILVIFLIIIMVVFVLLSLFYFFYPKKEETLTYNKPEHAMYNRERILKVIEPQLEAIALDYVRQKGTIILEKNIDEIQRAISNKELSYEELVAFYLDRIVRFDQTEFGINSISEINPTVMEQARRLDEQSKTDQDKGILYGMPLTIKENINTADMITSAGAYALRTFIPKEDAIIVNKLKEQNALILGKTNLSEFANFTSSTMPSGYSNKHGQTLNPYGPLSMETSGSSAGSATSITTNIGVLSLGTETTGSVVSPASHNSVVGLKPTKNAFNSSGVVPLASSLDTIGLMGKNILDTTYGFNSLVDNSDRTVDVAKLSEATLKNKRIGLLKNSDEQYEKAKQALKTAGAEVLDIELDLSEIKFEEIILNEFKFDFSQFATNYNLPFKTLKEIISFNKENDSVAIKYGQDLLEKAVETKENNREFVDGSITSARTMYSKIIDDNKLDSFVYIDADCAALTAVAGYPELTVPLGFEKPYGPFGLTFTQKNEREQELFELSYAFEQSTKGRQTLSDQEILDNIKDTEK